MSTNVGEIDLSLILNSDKFSSQLKNIDGQANTASSKISASLSKIGKAALAAFSVAAVTKFGKECLNVATETSNAWIGLNSILTGQGKSFDKAKSFINDYISDGLVPLSNAVTTYKNLAARGYSSDQIQKTMIALKNSATFGRQSTYSLGEAVQTASEGLKNENSILVDNAGVTKNVAKMWEDYAKSIGKTTNNLTQEEKIQAEVNGILQETKFQSNDAAIYANTYSGKVAQLNQAFTTMKTAIGNVIQPIAKLFVPIITTATNAITKLFTALAGLLSLFGLKADSVETVSSGIGDIATSAENASDAVGGIGDKTAKSAKKAKKALQTAGFDELDKLSDNSDSSGSGSGSSGGSGTSGITDKLDVTSTVTEDTGAFDGLLNKVKELANIFKKGFDASFGNTNFDGIIGHLQNIKNTVIDIWTDPNVLNSARQWVDTCLYSLGQMTGAVARTGINIAEGLLGSIDKYLSQNTDRIKGFIVNMFNISSKDIALTGNLWQALGEISDIFSGDTAKQIGADIIAMFANPFMSLMEVCGKFVTDLRAVFVQPIIDNVDKIKEAFNNTLGPIQTVTGTLAEAFTYVGDKWNEVYDTYISPLMESLKTGLSDTFGKFLDVYNTYVVPFLDNIATGFGTLWEEHLKPLVDKVGEFIGSVAQALTALWENVLKPVVDWIIQNIIPVLVPIFEGIWNTITTVFGSIADTIGGIIDTFKGLIDFVVGIFTGDWNKAWEGIKTFFTGIWEAIKGFFETIWNAIKGIVETAINIVSGIIQAVLNAIKTIWENIWNGVSSVVSSIWNAIVSFITNYINNVKSTISNVLNVIKTVWSNIWNGIKTVVSNIWNAITGTIGNVINGIKNTISNVLNTIKSIWDNIWTGLSNTVSNIFDGIWNCIKGVINSILGGIENMANGVINGLNGMTGAMNKLSFDVPDWVPLIGGNKFGFNIPKINTVSIPRLAQGGYVKANTPQLAMIGDNKHQGEVVAPEDKMLEMILTALKLFKEQNDDKSNRDNDPDINVNVILDGEVIQRSSRKRSDRLALATNGRCY
ncbi:MAG: hypothetical protein ACLU84_06685 [Clostridia bacterium]